MEIGMLSLLITYAVFGTIGWLIARRGSRPAGPGRFILLVVVAVVGDQIAGRRARLLDLFGLQMRVDWIIVACCLGGALGLVLRNRELRRRGARGAAS